MTANSGAVAVAWVRFSGAVGTRAKAGFVAQGLDLRYGSSSASPQRATFCGRWLLWQYCSLAQAIEY
jgi:hypothetical protein